MITLLDPGHGGKDPGCSGNGIVEAEYVYNFCANLSLQTWGICISRLPTQNISLKAAAEAAQKVRADLSICVHCNSAPDPNASGMRIFTLDDEPAHIWHFMKVLKDLDREARIVQLTAKDKKGYNNVYNVLAPYKALRLPAVLVELGFVTSPSDSAFLKSTYGQMILQGSLLMAIGSTGRFFHAKT